MPIQPESEALRLIRERALALFSERGFRGTSLRAIAAEANCDVALIPYYFSNKVTLYKSVVGAAVETAREGIRAGFAQANAARAADPDYDPLSTARARLTAWATSDGPVGIRTLLVTLSEGQSIPQEITEFARAELQSCVDLMVDGVPPEHRYALASYASLIVGATILRDFVRWERLTRLSATELVDVQTKALAEMLALSYERAARGEILA